MGTDRRERTPRRFARNGVAKKVLLGAMGLAFAAGAIIGITSLGPATSVAPETLRAAFYYPWFPEAWNQQGLNPFTHYNPTLGFYDGSSAAVVDTHIKAMQYAGMQAGIASWWGQGARTDARVPILLSEATQLGTGFKWALYHEQESSGDPSVAQLTSDLNYIASKYAGNPSYLRLAGKPVIGAFADPADGCGMATRWKQANAAASTHFYVILKVFPGYATCPDQPDQWHQYGPAVAESHQAGHSFTISPGFFKANESAPRLPRDLARWKTDVQAMAASGEPLQLVTSFNEWGEGTSIESAKEWASASGFGAYADVLHAVLGSSSPSTTAPTATTKLAIDAAVLDGTVNPNGLATTFKFEFGPTTNYGTSTAPKDAGAGSSPVPVRAAVASLKDGTTYHFRVVATNSGGTTFGDDQTFTTGSGFNADQATSGVSPITADLLDGLFCGLLGLGCPTTTTTTSSPPPPPPPSTTPTTTTTSTQTQPPPPPPSTTTTTTTAPPPPSAGDPVIAAAGDIACASNSGAPSNCDQMNTSSLILAMNPTAVLTLGDNQYESNTLADYQTFFNPSWGRFKAKIHPGIGNHEYLTTNAAGYFSYFGAAAGSASHPYYSYNVGAWHLISLNDECSHIGGCGPGSAEETWLKADLAAHPAICTLAYAHEPRFSSGQHGSALQFATLWNDLAAAHADVALFGHNHDVEVFQPAGVTPTSSASPVLDPNGIREFVVGTGGKNHYGFSAAPLTGEVVRDSTTYGVLKLTLHPTSYDWTFVNDPKSGSFTNSGSGACH